MRNIVSKSEGKGKAGDVRVGLPNSAINVCARLFHAAGMFAATQDIRYYLMGVYVEAGPDGGAVMCGTNGHQLALAFDPAGIAPKDGCIISLQSALKKATRSERDGRVLIVGDRVRVFNSMRQETYIQPGNPLIEGRFPQWWRVVPPAEGLVRQCRGTWSAGLLDRLTDAGRFLSGRHFGGITNWQRERGIADQLATADPMLTRFTIEPNFVVVTMPFSASDTDTAVPDFITPAMEAHKRRSEAQAARMAAADAKAVTA